MPSDDEYAASDFLEFTEEDFKQIDAHVARSIEAQPRVAIEIERASALDMSRSQTGKGNPLEPSREASHKSPSRSNSNPKFTNPLSRFRRQNWLSVTDISSLSWCEVQVEYGLRQMRFRPIDKRPPSFVSAQGREIKVSKTVAAANDKRQKQGKDVHKRLEREIKADEVRVDISSKEELWALRLINLMDSFQCIFREGYTREIPVFGVYKGVVIIGAIDEIRRHSYSQQPELDKPRRAPSPSGTRITDFFPSTPKKQRPELAVNQVGDTEPVLTTNATRSPDISNLEALQLIDTKTRKSRGLPSFEDSRPSRIQLMLYYRLFRDLISISPIFDFTSLWNQQGVDPSAPFSMNFLIQSALLAESNDQTYLCLNDLVAAWMSMVRMHNGCRVDSNLRLIYREVDKKSKLKKRGKKEKGAKRKRQASDSMVLPMTQDEIDLSMAIEASLRDISPQGEGSGTVDEAVQTGDSARPALHSASLELRALPKEPMTNERREDSDFSSNDSDLSSSTIEQVDTDDELTVRGRSIIGTTAFEYDEEMLNHHLEHAVEWWHGRKEPQGVSLENSHRCYSCEYQRHCEWREKKALELEDRRKMGVSHNHGL